MWICWMWPTICKFIGQKETFKCSYHRQTIRLQGKLRPILAFFRKMRCFHEKLYNFVCIFKILIKVEGCGKTYTHPSSLRKHLKAHETAGDIKEKADSVSSGKFDIHFIRFRFRLSWTLFSWHITCPIIGHIIGLRPFFVRHFLIRSFRSSFSHQ